MSTRVSAHLPEGLARGTGRAPAPGNRAGAGGRPDGLALVESDGGEPAVQLPLMNETMERLRVPGRPYIFLYSDVHSNPWSFNVARRNILPGMGLECDVVRISSTTSKIVGYHVIYGVFR